MTVPCIGTPISWLRLERYRLDELRRDEHSAIAAHLAACPTCAATYAAIEVDEARALPALAVPPALSSPRVVAIRPKNSAKTMVATAIATLAMVASFALAMRRDSSLGVRVAELEGNRPKGDAVAFSLVREDGARIDDDGGVYRDGDRFEAVVTCAPFATGASTSFDLAVFDSEGISFPVAPAVAIDCGNAVVLPGAFRLTGREKEIVCLVWQGKGVPARADITLARTPEALQARHLCKSLSAADGAHEGVPEP